MYSRLRMRGAWDVQKRPVVYAYTITLRCAVCGRGEIKTGESRPVEGASADLDIGTWRRIQDPAGNSHADPLRGPDLIVCSRACGDAACDSSLNEIFA